MKFTHTLFTVGLVLTLAACAPAASPKNESTGGGTSGHDGSKTAPVVLTVGDSKSGKIGTSSSSSDSESFYQFNTGDLTTVLVSISGSSPAHVGGDDYDLRLYSDAAMTAQVEFFAPNDHIAPYFTGLTTNTTYYLKLWNKLAAAATYTITVGETPVSLTQGSTGSPYNLNIMLDDSGTAAMWVSSLDSDDTSYYVFSPETTGTATITYPEGILDATLYTSSSFSGTPLEEEFSVSTKQITASVTSGTNYYLKIKNWSSDAIRVRGDLTITVEAAAP